MNQAQELRFFAAIFTAAGIVSIEPPIAAAIFGFVAGFIFNVAATFKEQKNHDHTRTKIS